MKMAQKMAFLFSLMFVTFVSFLFAFALTMYAQEIHYPVSKLNNCRDSQECYYFCEIPRNVPACWSYRKYILQKDVLGENTKSPEQIAKEHGITFPIAELENCSSPQSCMQYCNQPEHYTACTDFGKKKGIIQQSSQVDEIKVLSDAKNQLGCDSKQTCMAFCNDPANRQKCQSFAQTEGLAQTQSIPQPSFPPTIFTSAKQKLGCDSLTSCMQVCDNPDNFQKCQSFAHEHSIIPPQQFSPDSSQSASPYPPNGTQQYSHPNQPDNYQPPCADEQSCNQYCQYHPGQCPGSQQDFSNYHGGGSATQSPYHPTGSQPTSAPSQPPQQLQPSSPPPAVSGYSPAQQQQTCVQTPNCSWTGSTCNCPPGQGPTR